jgi:hypothetical protein
MLVGVYSLFYHSIHTESAGACQKDRYKANDKKERMFGFAKDIAVMGFEHSHQHGDDRRYTCYTGEQAEYDQEAAKEFSEYQQPERYFVAQTHETHESLTVLGKMHEFVITMSEQKSGHAGP